MALDKNNIRKSMRAKKNTFSTEELRQMSEPIVKSLLGHPAVASAKTILMYYSLPDEVYTHDAIELMSREGKTVLLPKVIDHENMELRIYKSPDDLVAGSYGILEPAGKPFTEYGMIETAVVPGMAFDKKRNRLGRGKGYYDRFLANKPHIFKIGVCFEFQLLEEITTDPFDVKMDLILPQLQL